MVRMIEAVFDGSVLRPTEPLTLAANTRVRVIIETLSEEEPPKSFLEVARNLNLEGPADWSANLDKYLYEDGRADDE